MPKYYQRYEIVIEVGEDEKENLQRFGKSVFVYRMLVFLLILNSPLSTEFLLNVC